jgi:hypothetical protein
MKPIIRAWNWFVDDVRATQIAWHTRLKWLSEKRKAFPLLGHLTTVRLADLWNAAIEYLHTLIWSTMPFWLGAFILYIQTSSGSKPLFEVFQSTFRNGELLVYTISTLTPITFYTLFEDPKGRFPHRLGIGTLAIIIIISCASLFALQKAAVSTKKDLIFHCSVVFTLCAILLRYIAAVYHKTRVPTLKEPDFTSSTNNFNRDFDKALDRVEAINSPTASSSLSDLTAALGEFNNGEVPTRAEGGQS